MDHARSYPRTPAASEVQNSIPIRDRKPKRGVRAARFLGQGLELWAARIAVICVAVVLCYARSPFGAHGLPAAGLGFLMAKVVLLAELRMRRAQITGPVGGMIGAVLGLLAALLITLVLSRTSEPEPTKSFFEVTSLFALGYLGLAVGSGKAREFQSPLPHTVGLSAASQSALKAFGHQSPD